MPDRGRIEGLERSLARDDPRALVQMTMGAGKTFTACTAILSGAGPCRHAGALLFLVDRRKTLAIRRATEYAAYRPPGTGRLFPELYGVQKLGPAGLDQSSAEFVISTIQRVYSVLTGKELAEEDEDVSAFEGTRRRRSQNLSPTTQRSRSRAFDLIVTDECHRSIYGSWRQVLEYFDAPSRPHRHTLEAHAGFFNQNLVAEYPYERSVADGVNVGFEIFRIRTQIGEGGATWSGYISRTGPAHPRRALPEARRRPRLHARRVSIVGACPEPDRTVLETYPRHAVHRVVSRPQQVPKTLIFAKDDHHAEEIVHIVREVFGKGNDFCQEDHIQDRRETRKRLLRNSATTTILASPSPST